MLARFDHRPMLTAALALATVVLVVVVVALSTLLFTAQTVPASTPNTHTPSFSGHPVHY